MTSYVVDAHSQQQTAVATAHIGLDSDRWGVIGDYKDTEVLALAQEGVSSCRSTAL